MTPLAKSARRCSLGLLIAIALGGCHLSVFEARNSSDWFVKSVKSDAHGDVITLHHDGKVYVARCAGRQSSNDKFYPDNHCGSLTQRVGATFQNGEGVAQIFREDSNLRYYVDYDKKSYEVWEVTEETVY
jgi:hypothetical protein